MDGADRSTPKRRELPDPDERGRAYEAMRAHASAETAGESSDATGESRHNRRVDGAGQRGYRNEVPRFMEMWAKHQRRWPETPRHATDPTSPDGDVGQRQGAERQAETAEVIGRVREAEPELSANVQAIEQENKHGGWLEGFKDRPKGKDRLEEKVAEKLAAEPGMTAAAALREVADAIRFTYCFQPENYTRGYYDMKERFESRGHEMYYSKNWWADPEYKGVNTRWATAEGQRFEVQFHTPESFHAKHHVTHLQLLPIYRCLDPVDGTLIRPSESFGLPGLDPERVRAGEAFHREIENAVAAHLGDDEYRQNRYSIHPVVGTFQPTFLSAKAAAWGIQMLDVLPGYEPDGDGTVPRISATPLEYPYEEGAMFVSDRHGSLQNNNGVLVQLVGILSGQDTSRVRAGSDIGLNIDDAFGPDEPVAFRVRSKDPMTSLTAVLTAANPGHDVARCSLGAVSDWRQTELAPLRPGSYRLTVAGDGVEPVTDTFVVFGAEEPGTQDVPASGAIATEERRTRGVPTHVIDVAKEPETIAEPALEERYLQGRFPERVRLRDIVSLLVRLGVSADDVLSSRLRTRLVISRRFCAPSALLTRLTVGDLFHGGRLGLADH